MSEHSLERITPTRENLKEFFNGYPDHQQRYEFAIQYLHPKMVIADIACGVGYGSWILSKHCLRVYGVDISIEALEHARRHFQEDNIDFIHAELFALYGQLDMIISFETIEHVNEMEGDKFLTKLKENLKEDGILIISTPINKTKNKVNVTEYHLREYDDFEFPEKLKKNGFEILEMYGQGSSFHKKLYGADNKIGIFSLVKLGLHRILPIKIRSFFKKILLGNPNEGLAIRTSDWRSSMIQIAVCKVKQL